MNDERIKLLRVLKARLPLNAQHADDIIVLLARIDARLASIDTQLRSIAPYIDTSCDVLQDIRENTR